MRSPISFARPVLEDFAMTGVAGFSSKQQEISVWSLVLYAADLPHKVIQNELGWQIVVPESIEESARNEIAAYELENSNWPPSQEHKAYKSSSELDNSPPTFPVMGAMIIFFAVTGPWSITNSWFKAGSVASRRIMENGEWWRIVTGLTLHADSVHVLGNAFIGGLFIHFLCRAVGTGTGWTLVLVSGALGNAINVLLRSGAHNSVGFSTAVFGAAGVLCGLRMRLGLPAFKGILLPLGAGFGLLAMLGAEGQRTDLGAHLWGLAAGIGIGAILAFLPWLSRWICHPRLQTVQFLFCSITVWVCWLLALNS